MSLGSLAPADFSAVASQSPAALVERAEQAAGHQEKPGAGSQQEQAQLPELQMGSVGRNMDYLVALPWIVPLPVSVDLSERDNDFFAHVAFFRFKAMCFLGNRLDR